MGGVIVLLTRGMGEWLTYGIPARYPVVLVAIAVCVLVIFIICPTILLIFLPHKTVQKVCLMLWISEVACSAHVY